MDKIINNKEDVVNSFNKFFVNLGPNRAEIINGPETTEGVEVDLWDRNPSSIFLRAVERNEIIDIVKK